MSGSAPAFDLHVVIDWSAAGRPTRGRDSIWAVAVVATERGRRALAVSGTLEGPVNPATRAEAARWLAEIVSLDVRTLVGIDVPLGVPAGLVDVVEPASPGADPVLARWERWWALVEGLLDDGADNANNRWWVGAELNRRIGAGRGPFWGCPPGVAGADLAATRAPIETVSEWRHVERVLREQRMRPFSVYQLAYAGSVGSQALTAIARLRALTNETRAAGRDVAVWPFDAPTASSHRVVIAEVWPSAFDLDLSIHPIRDAAQVLGVADLMVRADRSGALAPWMTSRWMHSADGARLDDDIIAAVCDEEGWVLGIDADGRIGAPFL